MQKILAIVFTIYSISLFGQERPSPAIIINDEVVTMAKAKEYEKAGRIKEAKVGVSDEDLKLLIQKFGDKIPNNRMSVMQIILFTDEEMKAKELKKLRNSTTSTADDSYLLKTGDTAKSFTLKLLNGKPLYSADFKGKVILLNFWEASCQECLLQFDSLSSKILQPFKNKGFVLVAVLIGEAKNNIPPTVTTLTKQGHFRLALDADSSVWKQYARIPLPKNFVIDQNGIIRFESTGYSGSRLDALAVEIQKLLLK